MPDIVVIHGGMSMIHEWAREEYLVITDYATFAYLGDVFILEPFRGQGLSKWLMDVIVAHPELQGLRRWILLTRDAHGLYRKVGFTGSAYPDRYMERLFPNVYKGAES